MEERNYQVQEAVRLIGVESHVLRYWEEELGVVVERTRQGYRIYSEENIQFFRQVKELKAQGIGLKAIRLLLGDKKERKAEEMDWLMQSLKQTGASQREDTTEAAEEVKELHSNKESNKKISKEIDQGREENAFDTSGCGEQKFSNGEEPQLEYEIVTNESETMAEFEKILKRIIREVVTDQNEKLELAVAELIREELEIQLDAILEGMKEAAAGKKETGSIWQRIREYIKRIYRQNI